MLYYLYQLKLFYYTIVTKIVLLNAKSLPIIIIASCSDREEGA